MKAMKLSFSRFNRRTLLTRHVQGFSCNRFTPGQSFPVRGITSGRCTAVHLVSLRLSRIRSRVRGRLGGVSYSLISCVGRPRRICSDFAVGGGVDVARVVCVCTGHARIGLFELGTNCEETMKTT